VESGGDGPSPIPDGPWEEAKTGSPYGQAGQEKGVIAGDAFR
jgi:hypothetical protein